MIIVAFLLLPVLSLLLFGLDLVEDRWVARPPASRPTRSQASHHARPRRRRRFGIGRH
ncbi:hypothetical protein [Streptomyces sp. NPDC127190]|uniref:hypothetical protein n=1 Tax=unclassified Streptomyces TaxID=2593676 RepID=UPI00363E92FF